MTEPEKTDEQGAAVNEDADYLEHALVGLSVAFGKGLGEGKNSSNGGRLDSIVYALVGIGLELREINEHLAGKSRESPATGPVQMGADISPRACLFHGTVLADDKPCPLCDKFMDGGK